MNNTLQKISQAYQDINESTAVFKKGDKVHFIKGKTIGWTELSTKNGGVPLTDVYGIVEQNIENIPYKNVVGVILHMFFKADDKPVPIWNEDRLTAVDPNSIELYKE